MNYVVQTSLLNYLTERHGEEQMFAASHVECQVLGLMAGRIDGGLLWAVRAAKDVLAKEYAKSHPDLVLGPLRTLHIKMEPPVDEPCQTIFYRLVVAGAEPR